MISEPAIQVIAPALIPQAWSQSSVLGSLTWLWLQSKNHQQYTLHTFGRHVLPALDHRQFALFVEQDQPVGYISWAWFNEEAEQAYIQSNQSLLAHPEWWHSGHRLWFIDWFAPFGHTPHMKKMWRSHLMPTEIVCALHHKGEQTGFRINAFPGAAISHEELLYWRTHHSLPWIRQKSVQH